MNMFKNNMNRLIQKISEHNIDTAIITDDDNVYYLTGYYDYLHMEFGRPTILLVKQNGESILITPTIDLNMATDSANVTRIVAWNDGKGKEWRQEIPENIKNGEVAIEPLNIPNIVKNYISENVGGKKLKDITPILSDMRMIKSEEELKIARHAGEMATEMMLAGKNAIKAEIPEFEVALEIAKAGARKAAELLDEHYTDKYMSPTTHFLQIMASGDEITKTHHRASTRIMKHAEPVFLCFCGMTNFHRFKLGFDRTFWIKEIIDKNQEKIYNVAVESQRVALEAVKPEVTAESVHQKYAEVIQDAGFEYPFRCGRATGFSYLEKPQIVTGDKTILKPGMVLAIDGSVLDDKFRAQIGDSIIVTENGFERITKFPNKIDEMIVG